MNDPLSITAAARDAPDAVALHVGRERYTFAQLADLVSTRLAALGPELKPGRAVPLVGRNTLERVVALYTLLEARVPVLLLHPKLTPAERAAEIAATERAGTLPPDAAVVMYTSGTTGQPRGAVLTRCGAAGIGAGERGQHGLGAGRLLAARDADRARRRPVDPDALPDRSQDGRAGAELRRRAGAAVDRAVARHAGVDGAHDAGAGAGAASGLAPAVVPALHPGRRGRSAAAAAERRGAAQGADGHHLRLHRDLLAGRRHAIRAARQPRAVRRRQAPAGRRGARRRRPHRSARADADGRLSRWRAARSGGVVRHGRRRACSIRRAACTCARAAPT